MGKKPWDIWDSKFDMVKDKTLNWCPNLVV